MEPSRLVRFIRKCAKCGESYTFEGFLSPAGTSKYGICNRCNEKSKVSFFSPSEPVHPEIPVAEENELAASTLIQDETTIILIRRCSKCSKPFKFKKTLLHGARTVCDACR